MAKMNLIPVLIILCFSWGFPCDALVKNLPANAGDVRDSSSIPGLGRCPGGGKGNLLQYSCLGNPLDGGVWRATVHGDGKNQTQRCAHTRVLYMNNLNSTIVCVMS